VKNLSEISQPVVAIVLAAGSSRRFGSDKRLHVIEGVNLLQRSLSKPLAMNIPTLVVLRPSDKGNVSDLLGSYLKDPRVELLFAADADRGMGHSLACAARYLVDDCTEKRNPNFREMIAALVLLADMPWIKLESIANIVGAYSEKKIVIPTYKNEWGHPILFSRRWFDDLEKLSGDRGAKHLLQANRDALIELQVGDEGIFRDVDVAPD
jgi:molybdenum cofactor cytidylyltransferase